MRRCPARVLTRRGRAIVEAANGNMEVDEDMEGLADLLRTLSGPYWPGHVSALVLDCNPGDCRRALDVSLAQAPRTWLEAAELAEAALDHRITLDDRDGPDEDGWADAPEPLSAAPEDNFNEAVNLIESISGPLQEKPCITADQRRTRAGPHGRP